MHLHSPDQGGVVNGGLQAHLASRCDATEPDAAVQVKTALHALVPKQASHNQRAHAPRMLASHASVSPPSQPSPELQSSTADSPTTSRIKARSWRLQV